jgi:hypothetical protein
MMYTDRDIQEAKAFIRKRVEAELSMQKHLDEALLWAAKEIITISYKYKIKASMFKFSANPNLKSEVDAVLAKLRAMLYEYTETLSVVVDEAQKDDIIAFINEESYGSTLKERINTYTNRFKYEVEAFIASGLLMGYAASKLLSTIRANLSAPYNNQLFRNTVVRGGMAATRIKTGGITYGQGHSNSARNLLNTLTRNIIGAAWMNVFGTWAYNKGAVGFYSFRGSSYPCAFCDSQVGYHPIHEYKGYWHLNCRCYFVFVYP